MNKKVLLIIICLIILTGCSKSNKLDLDNKEIKDNLVCHLALRDNEKVNDELDFNFDKSSKLISIYHIEEWDYSDTSYNIEVLKNGIDEKNKKCKYSTASIMESKDTPNALRFSYITDVEKIREDFINSTDKEKLEDELEDEMHNCGLYILSSEIEEFIEYKKEDIEKIAKSDSNSYCE